MTARHERKSRTSSRRRALYALALVAAVALVCAVVLHQRRPPTPTADVEGTTWSHEDLLNYLSCCRLKLEAAPVDNSPDLAPAQRWVAPAGASVFVRRFRASPMMEHPGSLVWGRFVVLGDRDLIAALYAALNVPARPTK